MDGTAVGGWAFTGGTVANATTFSSDATVDGTLAVGSLSDVESSINTIPLTSQQILQLYQQLTIQLLLTLLVELE